ncbi:hypothetical protein [Bacillus sp. CH_203]|uniref:hypothetical protein n=1 Tax=Bacillus sp. CH_203 TaxID=2978216 RepID=UPI0030F7F27F|nr:hypothetical protein [Bacillus cereus]
MATSFVSINKKFLGMIDDYTFGKVSDEELNEVLFGYLDEARSLHFPQCSKDLELITEENGVGEFHETLTSQEQHILALGMKKAWISSKLYNADLMSKEIGDRDYKAVQGTGYLKEISKIDKQLKDEIHEYAVAYTYKNFSTEEW